MRSDSGSACRNGARNLSNPNRRTPNGSVCAKCSAGAASYHWNRGGGRSAGKPRRCHQVGRRDVDHRPDDHRRLVERSGLELGAEDWRARPTPARHGQCAERTHGGHAAPRRGQSLRGRDRVRLGARSYCRHADDARCISKRRRSARNRPRYVSRPAERILFRDEPCGFARGWTGVRQRAAQYRVGRHLGRSNDPYEQRLDGGVCHSIQEPQFSGRTERLGLQHRSNHLAQARGRSLVGCAPRHAVSSDIRSR